MQANLQTLTLCGTNSHFKLNILLNILFKGQTVHLIFKWI